MRDAHVSYPTAMDRIDQVLSYVRYALSTPSNRIFGYLSIPSLRPNLNQKRDKAMQHTKMRDAGNSMRVREVWKERGFNWQE